MYRERGNPWTRAERDGRCIYCRNIIKKGSVMVKFYDGYCCRRCYLYEYETNRMTLHK